MSHVLDFAGMRIKEGEFCVVGRGHSTLKLGIVKEIEFVQSGRSKPFNIWVAIAGKRWDYNRTNKVQMSGCRVNPDQVAMVAVTNVNLQPLVDALTEHYEKYLEKKERKAAQ